MVVGAATLVIEANATSQVGAGHVMRCSSLAERWIASGCGTAVFSGTISLPWVAARVRAMGAGLQTKPVEPAPLSVLVLDDYDPAARTRAAARVGFALRVLVDDLGGPVNSGFDVVWNPNAHATEALYAGFRGTVLAGADVLAAREGLPGWTPRDPLSIAVMLGGGGLRPAIRDAFAELARRMKDRRFAGVGDWVPSEWTPLSPEDPWPVAATCGLAISAAGTTMWEVAVTGAPAVLVQLASNQSANSAWARAQGCPVVAAVDVEDPLALASQLAGAVGRAQPLPRLRPGAWRVARHIRDALVA